MSPCDADPPPPRSEDSADAGRLGMEPKVQRIQLRKWSQNQASSVSSSDAGSNPRIAQSQSFVDIRGPKRKTLRVRVLARPLYLSLAMDAVQAALIAGDSTTIMVVGTVAVGAVLGKCISRRACTALLRCRRCITAVPLILQPLQTRS